MAWSGNAASLRRAISHRFAAAGRGVEAHRFAVASLMITTQHRTLPFQSCAWRCRCVAPHGDANAVHGYAPATLFCAPRHQCFALQCVAPAQPRQPCRCFADAVPCQAVPGRCCSLHGKAIAMSYYAILTLFTAMHSHAPGPAVHGRAMPSHRFAKEFIATAVNVLPCFAASPLGAALFCFAAARCIALPARCVRCISRLVYAVASLIGEELCPRWAVAVASHATPCPCINTPNSAAPKPCAASRGYTMAVHCNDGHIPAMPPRCVGRRCIAGAIQCLVLLFQCVA